MVEPFNPYQSPASFELPLPGGQPVDLSAQELSYAATGLRLIFAGVILGLLNSLLTGIFSGIIGAMMVLKHLNHEQSMGLIKSVSIVSMILASIGMLLEAAGGLFCLVTTKETGSRGTILTSVGLLIAVVLVLVLRQLGMNFPGANLLAGGVELLGIIVFLIYLRSLAQFLSRPDLAGRARLTSIFSGVCLALWALSMALAVIVQNLHLSIVVGGPQNNPLVMILGLAVIVMGLATLVTFILYAVLVAQLRTAVVQCEPAEPRGIAFNRHS